MANPKKFGTFGGVFTPSILTILGVIMYMRLPMIAGEAGLVGTLGIILVAHLISITTGLSVSSIATDKKVKEGGTYYIISRSLGLPIGGTLGLALFVGLSFSVSLYLIGFSESFLDYFNLPRDIDHIRITGSIILLVVTIITFISTSLAIKTQYLIMAAIFLSLLSIFFGHHNLKPVSPNFFGVGTGVPLMVLFGIFFPAVTGFEAGVSMSGDLKDPKKSIPLGTISAIAIGLLVYIGLAFFYAYTVDGKLLATDSRALFKIALVPQLVIAGIWGATLSSALGSILAAPRILQSTAIDKITPRIFSRGTGSSGEPRNALILTFFIAEAGILIGQLDVIARIVSIFFITTYGFLNLSAAFESITSADFRPSFRTPAWVSVVGFLACFLVMIQLDFIAMIGAVVILGILFLFIKQRQLVLETGDTWSSVWSTLVRTGLDRLDRSSMHARNWRPNIILFCGQDKARPHLIELASAFSGRLGMYSAFEMVESGEQRLVKDKRYYSVSGKDDKLLIRQHKCRNIYDGMDEISRVFGFTGIEPNTILMGWSRNEKNKEQFLRTIRNFEESDYNSILLNYNPLKKYGNKKTIDVWWSGWGSNLTFTLFLLRHLTSSGDWKDARIRLLVINNIHNRTEFIYKTLQKILTQYRIDLEIKIINNNIEGQSKEDIIRRESSGTDLTFIGIPDKQYQHIDNTYQEVMNLSQHLGTFLLVNSSSRFESFDVGLEFKQEEDRSVSPVSEPELPELHPSKYTVINDNIKVLDTDGQKILTLFFQKAISPVFSGVRNLSDELLSVIDAVFLQLNKLNGIEETYRRRKTLIKIKNDFYFRTNQIFTDLDQKKLGVQTEEIAAGLNWYIDRLEQDLLKLPVKLIIPYEKNDLILRKNDPLRLKLFILRKRLAHPFSKNIIPGKIRYNEIAAYYLRNNRHYYLSSFLNRFQSELYGQFTEVRALITSVDTMLETLFEKAVNKDELISSVKTAQKANKKKTGSLISGINQLEDQIRHSLMQEFRKNLQLMSYDMGKADINFRIRRKQRNKKYYEKLVLRNSSFAESWQEQTIHQINKIRMDIILQSFKSRIKDKINELNLNIAQQLDYRFSMELQSLRAKLEKFSEMPEKISELKISISSFEESITILKDFNQFGKEILLLTESLPENIIIALSVKSKPSIDSDEDCMNVPLRKITRFYIESRFIGATYDELEKIAGYIKNSIFIIHDLLNLTRFNLENIPADLPDKHQVIISINKDTSQKIMEEDEKIVMIKNNINTLIENSLEEVFDKLSSYKIPLTVSEYSGFIREHQSQLVRKTFAAYFDRLKSSLRYLATWALYSRSEWILMARKIMESDQKVSGNQKILDLIESVSPRGKVIDRLPQFYKKLFSGRSIISEDFWISRGKDEELFSTALRRINSGYKGGIMIVGDRSSGKTAFCRYVAERHFKKENVTHLFPIYKGSAQVSDFVDEIRKITRTQGSIEEIMESLPQGSVFFIHDLELWWERSINGWDVIRLLVSLINRYSKTILFVVNMNPYSFSLMNKMLNLQDSFISVIAIKPFDSMDIQEIIMRRHRSSGLKFVLQKREEEDLSEIRMAGLFNKFFNYSEGNPGIALIAWLGNIVSVSEKRISIRSPYLPDTKILAELDEDWKIVLIQLILHKRLTFERINKIFFLEETRSQEMVNSMLRAGLIEERREHLYIVNEFIEPHLIRFFKKEGLL